MLPTLLESGSKADRAAAELVSRELRAFYERLRSGLTPRRRELAAMRFHIVADYLDWCGRQHERRDRFRRERRRRWGGHAPQAPSVAGFHRHVQGHGFPWGYRTLQAWVNQYLAGGPLTLIDARGCWQRGRVQIDADLWYRLLRGVAGGRSIAAMDRQLRPIAERRQTRWTSLRTLQGRVKEVRTVMDRNPHLFRDRSPN